MEVNSIVVCVKGHPGVLEEGAYYTISGFSKNNGVLLFEVDPPAPYTSFREDRFKEVLPPEDIASVVEQMYSDTLSN